MAKFIDIVLRAKDFFSAKTDKATESIGGLKTEIKALDKELKDIEKAQDAITVFTELSEESQSLSQSVDKAKASLSQYAEQQAKASQAATAAEQEYKALKSQISALQSTYNKQNKSLADNSSSLSKAKTEMTKYGDAVLAAKRNVESTTDKYLEQKQVFEQLEAKYKSSKQPLDSLSDSYKNAKSELQTLEQVHKSQLKTLTTAEAKYQEAYDDMAGLDKAQRSYADSLEKTEKSLRENSTAQQKATAKQKEANQELSETSANYKTAAKSVQTLSDKLTKNSVDLGKANAKLKAAGVDSSNLASATEKLASKQAKLAASSKSAFSSLTKITTGLKSVKDAANKANSGISGVTRNIVALAATYIGIDTLKNRLVDLFTTGDKFEKMQQQLVAVMGSIESGEQASKWIKDFTKTVPFGVEQVTESFLRLKNFGLDPMDGSLQAIVDLNEKLGGGQERLSGISLALGQAWAKQKFQGEEILQLIERGVPVWSLLEKVTGKNTLELQKLSSAGKLGRDTIKLLIDEIGRSSQGEAAKGMSRLSGIISNAKDRLDEFYDLIATSGSMDWLKSQVTQLNAKFDEMSKNGQLTVWAKKISQAIIDIGEGVKTTVVALVKYRDEIGTVVKAWALLKVGSFFLNVVSGAKVAGVALASFATKLGIINTASSAAAVGTGLLAGKTLNLVKVLKGGLVVAVAASAYQFGRFTVAVYDLIVAKRALSESEDLAATQQDKAIAKLKEFNKEHGLTFKTMKEAIEAMDSGAIVLDKVTGKYITAAVAQQQLATASKLTDEQIQKQIASAEVHGIAIEKANSKAQQQIDILKEQSTVSAQLTVEVKKNASAISDAERSLQKNILTGKSTAEIDEKLIKLYAEKTSLAERQTKANQDLKDSTEKLNTKYGEGLVKIQGYQAQLAQLELSWKSGSIGITEYTNAKDLLNRQIDLLLPSLSAEQKKTLELAKAKDNLTNSEQQLQSQKSKSNNITQQQTEKQEQLNKANSAAASHAGANVAFQKLWNEAKARSLQLYDLLSLSTEKLNKRTKELGESLSSAFRRQSWSSIMAPINAYNNLAEKNELQAIKQTKAYKQLFSALESGSVSLRNLNFYSENANRLFDKLSDTNLSALHAQIEAARSATKGLKDELSDTIHSLKNELDELEGNKADVLKRDYEADNLELEQKLKEAEKTGDRQAISDAKEALGVAKQIYKLRTQAVVAEQKEEIQTTKNISENNNTTTNIKQATQVQEIHYKVTFAVGGRSSTFNIAGGSNVEQLMTALAESGFTVTRT